MPQTISDNLKASLNRPTPVYKKTIELYRQAWSGSAYIYDSAIDITDYLTEDSAGTIMWKLDKEDYGVFNLDNVTLTFRNDRNQWKQDNPKGLFPSGKLINQSKIIIKIGAQLVDGTYETLRSFTGYISGDPDYNPEEKTVSMTLVSAMSIFEKKSAEEISTLVTNEAHAYSAPDIVAYNTANNGVAAVRLVVKRGATADGAGAATEIKPTTGYEISNQNKKALPLTVTLVTALTATESIWITYIYWYQDKLLEWLATQVMTLCGITSYSISPAVFSSSIENTWDFNSQADWNTCGLSSIDTITTPGSFKAGLLDNFEDGDYSANPAWVELYGSGIWSIVGNKLKIIPVSSLYTLKTASTKTTGSWQFQLYTLGYFAVNDYCRFYFMGTGEEATYKYPTAGYYLIQTVGNLRIKRADGTVLINTTIFLTSSNTVRISRDAAGVINLYVNEVLKGTSAPDLTHITSDRMCISAFTVEPDPAWKPNFYIDDIYVWDYGTTPGIGILTSPVKDTGGSLASWGKLTATFTPNSATVLIETATSSDNITYDAWTAIDGTGQILSAIKQYIKYRVTATLASMTNPVTPIFDQITIKYYTSATVIDLVNLTGMTCRQVLDRITEMPAYEMGFKADDTFIYRPRLTSVPAILDLTSTTNIKTLRNLSDGIDRVYNRVKADFGIYQEVSDASGDAEPNSITKYGTREYAVTASNLLPAANVNLAYAVAPTILNYTKTPRRRCTVETKLLLWPEIGDKVTVYLREDGALRQWRYGDRDVVWGQVDLEYYNAANLTDRLSLWGGIFRIEGITFDFINWATSFDLVEVLTEA